MTKRVVYFDILNILACLCVIWLHFNNEVHWYAPTRAWYQASVVQVVAYWAVPIFFMLTGATLMRYRERYTTKIFICRRLKKVFVPFLIWGAVFAIWRMGRGELEMNITTFPQAIYSITSLYLNNRMEPIYWFFAPLFSIYISMPVLSLLAEKENANILKYCLLVGILTISILPFGYNLFVTLLRSDVNGGWWNGSWQISVLGGYLLFPVLGYWAAAHDFQKHEKIIIYITAILCCLFKFIGMTSLFSSTGEKPNVFFDYLSFPSVAYALAVFIFFRYCDYSWLNNAGRKIISTLASCSFGVYLIHILVLTCMERVVILRGNIDIWHFIAPVICYGICVAFVLICKKVPVLKHLFP